MFSCFYVSVWGNESCSYCWWLTSCTTWDVWNPINNGINYQPQLVRRISAMNSSITSLQNHPRSFWWVQLSNEKNLGWSGFIGDEKLPSYIGIIINHDIRIPFLTIQYFMESRGPRVFWAVAQLGFVTPQKLHRILRAWGLACSFHAANAEIDPKTKENNKRFRIQSLTWPSRRLTA